MLKSLHPLLALSALVLAGLKDLPPLLASTWNLDIFCHELVTGFRHIVPEGPDHMALIIGLFFLSRTLPALLIQTTLFTLAHSAMLGIVIFTGLEVPVRWVEIAVGLSIAALAAESFLPGKLERWRPLTLLIFGGIHGLAFAHSLVQAQNIRSSPVSALFGFNLGIELGQLALIGLLLLVFAPWWKRVWYQRRICQPVLLLISLCGLHWAWERW
ncbi:MAG TPA: HupE/UreJ family protein [Prosthecobacter sp.]